MSGTPTPWRESSLAWLRKFHAASDSLNPDYVDALYTEDAALQFANYPEIKGREGIKQFFVTQFGALSLMKHEIGHIDVVHDRIYQYATISYVVKGDPEQKTITIPGFAVFHKSVDEDRLRRFEVFLDPAPILERIQTLKSI